jgi:hypothetical protein
MYFSLWLRGAVTCLRNYNTICRKDRQIAEKSVTPSTPKKFRSDTRRPPN